MNKMVDVDATDRGIPCLPRWTASTEHHLVGLLLSMVMKAAACHGPQEKYDKHTLREAALVPPTAARKSADTPGTRDVEPALISMATAAAVVAAVSSKRLDLRLLVVAVVCISHSNTQRCCSSGRFDAHKTWQC